VPDALINRGRDQFRTAAQQRPLVRILCQLVQQMAFGKDGRIQARDHIGADGAKRLVLRDLAISCRLEQLTGPTAFPDF
jgi:hypothetical protein